MNDSGQIVGYIFSSSGNQGFVDTNGSFTTINAPGAIWTYAYGINNSGQIVGSSFVGDSPDPVSGGLVASYQGFVDTNGTFTAISAPGAAGLGTLAYGINDSGQMVGAYENSSGNVEGFVDTNGTFTTISLPGTTETFATGINDSGQIVGYYLTSSGYQGFVDTNGAFTTISVPGALETIAWGINDSGQVVGYSYGSSGCSGGGSNCYQGFVDTNGTLTTISVPSADTIAPCCAVTLGTYALGINDSGQIAGYYEDSFGDIEGFVDTSGTFTTIAAPGTVIPAVPEPSSLALLATAATGLLYTLRRRL